MEYKIQRTLILAILIVTIIVLLGFSDGFGYSLNTPVFSTILVKHILAILNIYVLFVIWKQF